MHVYTPVLHIVHPGIAVVVYSALGRARSIVMCCVQYGLRPGPGKWFRGPGKVMEFCATKRVGTLYSIISFLQLLRLFGTPFQT